MFASKCLILPHYIQSLSHKVGRAPYLSTKTTLPLLQSQFNNLLQRCTRTGITLEFFNAPLSYLPEKQ